MNLVDYKYFEFPSRWLISTGFDDFPYIVDAGIASRIYLYYVYLIIMQEFLTRLALTARLRIAVFASERLR
jgi:hypothetical protein